MTTGMSVELIGAFLVVIAVLQIPVWWKVMVLQRHTRQYEAELRSLKDDMRAVLDGSINMEEYKLDTEQQLRRLAERQQQADYREPVSLTYNHAIKLAQKGVSIEELMAVCGLVRGEAELLIRLHRLN
jgi:hypothetical protein